MRLISQDIAIIYYALFHFTYNYIFLRQVPQHTSSSTYILLNIHPPQHTSSSTYIPLNIHPPSSLESLDVVTNFKMFLCISKCSLFKAIPYQLYALSNGSNEKGCSYNHKLFFLFELRLNFLGVISLFPRVCVRARVLPHKTYKHLLW